MPRIQVPIVIKDNPPWEAKCMEHLTKALPDLILYRMNPSDVPADKDVLVVCPCISRLEADLDWAFSGFNEYSWKPERKTIVLYIRNVTETTLSACNSQQDMTKAIQQQYKGIQIFDIGATGYKIYKCKRNDASMREIQELLGVQKERDNKVPVLSTTGPKGVGVADTSEYYCGELLQTPWREMQWDLEKEYNNLQKSVKDLIKEEDKIMILLGLSCSETRSFGDFIKSELDFTFDESMNDNWVVKNKQQTFYLVGAKTIPTVPLSQWMQSVLQPATMCAGSNESSGATSNNSEHKATTVSCVIFLADAKNIRKDSEGKFKQHLEEIRKDEIPRILVITHADEHCPLVSENIRNMYFSRAMRKVMKEAATIFQMPLSNVHAVNSLDSPTNNNRMLLLSALRQAVQFTIDKRISQAPTSDI